MNKYIHTGNYTGFVFLSLAAWEQFVVNITKKSQVPELYYSPFLRKLNFKQTMLSQKN
jgi:hypothetical protein